jgi:predicted PurR-regulated permease PerM
MSRENTTHQQPDRDRRLIALAALAVLALGTYVVLSPFFVALAWAIILVLVTWPAFRLLRGPLKHRPGLAAGLMTLLLAVVIIVPVGFLIFKAVDELRVFVDRATTWWKADEPEIPKFIKDIPTVGTTVTELVASLKGTEKAVAGNVESRAIEHAPPRNDHPKSLGETLDLQALLGFTKGVVGGTLGLVFKMAMCLFASYFLYRHGESLGGQLARVALHVGGPRYERLLQTVRTTVRAAVYGVLLTALAQGFLAGIGFFATGAPVPLLLALATVVASLIPFGPPFIYLGAAGAMLATPGVDWWRPAALAVWGAAIVSTADNVIRPLFISQATDTPILLVFMGVIGGIVAFGLIGVILGRVILTIAMVLWKEWAQADDPGPDVITGSS